MPHLHPTTLKATAGMSLAADHAEKENPGWVESALERVRAVARGYPQFSANTVREYLHHNPIEEPPSQRAWGQVYQALAKGGEITLIGYCRSTINHGSPISLWESNIYHGL